MDGTTTFLGRIMSDSKLPDTVWVMKTNIDSALIVLSYFEGLNMVEWYDNVIGDTESSSILIEIGRINEDGEFYVPMWIDGMPSVIHDSFIDKVDCYKKETSPSEGEFIAYEDDDVSTFRISYNEFDGSDL